MTLSRNKDSKIPKKMATPLDIGLIKQFSIIFPFLLTFVVVYGILLYTKSLGENKSLIALLAMVTSFIVILSPTVREVIDTMVPWFLLFFIFAFFGLIAIKSLGATDADIMGTIGSPEGKSVITWFVVISVIIGLGSLSYVLSQKGASITGGGATTDEDTAEAGERGDVGTTGKSAFWGILFHPKVLGLVLLFLIGTFTVFRLTYSFPMVKP